MAHCHEGQVQTVETHHFKERCKERGILRPDVVQLLWRGTVAGEPSLNSKTGRWTYQVQGSLDGETWTVVIGFAEDGSIVLVTVYPEEDRR